MITHLKMLGNCPRVLHRVGWHDRSVTRPDLRIGSGRNRLMYLDSENLYCGSGRIDSTFYLAGQVRVRSGLVFESRVGLKAQNRHCILLYVYQLVYYYDRLLVLVSGGITHQTNLKYHLILGTTIMNFKILL